MKRIVFYGDSNTCGLDGEAPRGSGSCFPEEKRWIGRIRYALKENWLVEEEGRVGRCIPTLPYEWEELGIILSSYERINCFSVMLGTNDCLSFPHPAPEKAGERMRELLRYLKKQGIKGEGGAPMELLVIAPPYLDFQGDRFYAGYSTTDGSLSRALELAARQEEADFLDAGGWDIPCGSDHIHLTEEGHRILGEKLLEEIRKR